MDYSLAVSTAILVRKPVWVSPFN